MQPAPHPPFLTAHTRRRVVGLALLMVVAAGSGAARADSAAGVFVQTTALRLQDDQAAPIDPRKRRVRFKSSTKKDAAPNRVVAPAPRSAGDPTTMGGVVVVQNASGTGEAARVDLPPAGWKLLGSPTRPKGYLFKNGTPGAAISKVVVKDDSLVVRGGGAAWSYTLDEPQQGRVAVRLQLGGMFWCAEAPGKASGRPPTTARNDKPGKFVAAAKTPAPVACAMAPPAFQLTVDGGHGDGSYAAGATVHVWADVRPWDQVVTGWTGDGALLREPAEWHTTLEMPARDVAIAAAIVDRPVTLQIASYTGATTVAKTIFSSLPPNPRGLVLMLHGTNGSANFITRTEAFAAALRALESGYGVLGTESEETVAGDLDGNGLRRWNPALNPANVDFANLNALVASLRAAGTIAPTTPLFAVGMSNGGAMAVGLGAVASSGVAANFPSLRFAAVVSHCADARADAVAVTTTPTAWLMCANDDNDAVSNAAAQANSAALAARGVPTVFDAHPASPLYPQRFARVQGIAPATSAAVAAELGPFVGADGFFVVPRDAIAAQLTADPSLAPTLASLAPSLQREVLDQVGAMQAVHEMYSDWAARTVAWLDAHQP